MEVITLLRPENSFIPAMNSRPAPKAAPREAAQALPRIAMEFPAPFVFLVAMAALLSTAPLLQDRLGHYRLERISLASDDSLPLAFDVVLAPGGQYLPEAGAASDSATLNEPLPVPEALRTVTWQRYTVRAGDSVSRIASRFGLRNVGTLLAVNGIDNARRLRVGQTLEIPSMDGLRHTVSKGDTLSGLAKRHGVSVTALLDVNDLSSEILSAGQTLFIPGAALSRFDLKKAMGELFIRPVAGRLTSPYGYRADPFTGARTFHTGIDLAVPQGTPVKAIMDGKVAVTGYSPVYGNYVIISHDGGYQSLYGHLLSIGVRKGSYLLQGAQLGKAGNTGYSTGPHVHLSIYKNGKMINPLSVLD